jgi:hypothetical protein
MKSGRGKREKWSIVTLGLTHGTEGEAGRGGMDGCQKVPDKKQKFSPISPAFAHELLLSTTLRSISRCLFVAIHNALGDAYSDLPGLSRISPVDGRSNFFNR